MYESSKPLLSNSDLTAAPVNRPPNHDDALDLDLGDRRPRRDSSSDDE